nr:pentatricopeptide repeat-containing protein At2g20710, mitochondrial-like isoform X1 [Coffea arabica]
MMARNLLRSFTSPSSLNPVTKIKNYFSIDRNLGPLSFFCSTATAVPSPTSSPSSPDSSESVPKDSLFARLVRVRKPKDSIPQVLQKWVDEGREVDLDNVRIIIKSFRSYKRYSYALRVSEWINSIQHSKLKPADAAVHLDLIAKVHGLEQAEKYFERLPDNLRVIQTHGALLNCYVKFKSLRKAEEMMQKMRQLGYNKTLSYSAMLTLYVQTRKLEKLDSLVQEMDSKGIPFDNFSYNIWLNACVVGSDIVGMEKLLMRMEADPVIVMQWNSYVIAANGYLKAGDFKKAEVVLKKAERLIEQAKATGRRRSKAHNKADEKAGQAYEFLLTLYATMGRKDEVLRLWNLYKKPRKIYNRSCFCVISCLLKLDDLDGADKMLDEWLANKEYFDIRIPDLLVTAFCKKGHIERAESIISRLVDSGNEPTASTWSRMAQGYNKTNQMENTVEMTKKSIAAGVAGWEPDLPVLASCLRYLKKKGDIAGAEEMLRLLKRCEFSAEFKDVISRYIRKGDPAFQELYQAEEESETSEQDIFGDTELNFEHTS